MYVWILRLCRLLLIPVCCVVVLRLTVIITAEFIYDILVMVFDDLRGDWRSLTHPMSVINQIHGLIRSTFEYVLQFRFPQ